MGKKLTIGIYKITSPTGRVYIGQSRRIFNRFCSYRRLKCASQPLLYKSLVKYGPDQHSFEIVYKFPLDVAEEVLNQYEVFFWEQHIEAGVSMLNIKEPGRSGRWAESSKQLLSERRKGAGNPMYGVKMSPENVERLRQNWAGPNHPTRGKDMSGANNPSFGTKRSKEYLEGRVKLCSKPVWQLTLEGEFIKEWESIKVAQDTFGFSNLSSVCTGRKYRHSAYGFKWIFKPLN